jgi:uncharacterized protein (TIGR02300 family)
VAEQKWGNKRICLSCGARFYDMLRSPIICPKCETEFQPVVSGRGSRAKAALPVPAPEQIQPVVEGKVKSDLLVAEEDIPDDSGIGILDDDNDSNDDDLIEDTADLGAEDNVLDGIGSNPEKSDDLTG